MWGIIEGIIVSHVNNLRIEKDMINKIDNAKWDDDAIAPPFPALGMWYEALVDLQWWQVIMLQRWIGDDLSFKNKEEFFMIKVSHAS